MKQYMKDKPLSHKWCYKPFCFECEMEFAHKLENNPKFHYGNAADIGASDNVVKKLVREISKYFHSHSESTYNTRRVCL